MRQSRTLVVREGRLSGRGSEAAAQGAALAHGSRDKKARLAEVEAVAVLELRPAPECEVGFGCGS